MRWCSLQAHLWSFVLRQMNVSPSQIAASGEWPERPNHRDRRLLEEEMPQSVRKLRTSEGLRRSVAARYTHSCLLYGCSFVFFERRDYFWDSVVAKKATSEKPLPFLVCISWRSSRRMSRRVFGRACSSPCSLKRKRVIE